MVIRTGWSVTEGLLLDQAVEVYSVHTDYPDGNRTVQKSERWVNEPLIDWNGVSSRTITVPEPVISAKSVMTRARVMSTINRWLGKAFAPGCSMR